MTFALLVMALVLAPAGPRAQWKTPWSYKGANGPEHWATCLEFSNQILSLGESVALILALSKSSPFPLYSGL